MITKEEIKIMLPHGALTEVAKRAGVTKSAVTRFFNNKIISSPKIEKAALEYALKYKKDKQGLINKLKSISA